MTRLLTQAEPLLLTSVILQYHQLWYNLPVHLGHSGDGQLMISDRVRFFFFFFGHVMALHSCKRHSGLRRVAVGSTQAQQPCSMIDSGGKTPTALGLAAEPGPESSSGPHIRMCHVSCLLLLRGLVRFPRRSCRCWTMSSCTMHPRRWQPPRCCCRWGTRCAFMHGAFASWRVCLVISLMHMQSVSGPSFPHEGHTHV